MRVVKVQRENCRNLLERTILLYHGILSLLTTGRKSGVEQSGAERGAEEEEEEEELRGGETFD